MNSTVDLSNQTNFSPWDIAHVCLAIAEHQGKPGFEVVLPKDDKARLLLEQYGLGKFLAEIGLPNFGLSTAETEDPNIQPISFCPTKDIFSARLDKFRLIYKGFGLDNTQFQFLTAIVGELGNNVFDHNLGNWPFSLTGAIILGSFRKDENRVEVVVADPGIGFKQSLKDKNPGIGDQTEAIKLALEKGVSGRIEETRGNGLRYVQEWTICNLNGNLKIQSYDGLVNVSQAGIKQLAVPAITGTIVSVEAPHSNDN